jgi:hypothetical protein
MARPKKEPPADAKAKIEVLGATGASKRGAAAYLGVDYATLCRWLEEDEELEAAFAIGREKERRVLHNALFMRATKGNDTTAAIFLLKARHGYRENDPADQGSRVLISLNLPAPQPLETLTLVGQRSVAND